MAGNPTAMPLTCLLPKQAIKRNSTASPPLPYLALQHLLGRQRPANRELLAHAAPDEVALRELEHQARLRANHPASKQQQVGSGSSHLASATQADCAWPQLTQLDRTCAMRASEVNALLGPAALPLACAAATAAAAAGPLKPIVPELGGAKPATSCSRVVLPEPLRPKTRPSWLGGSDKLTSVSSGSGAPAGQELEERVSIGAW